MAISLSLIEALHYCFLYRFKQPLTHGSAMWADTAWLKSEGFAQDFTTILRPGELQLCTLPTGHQLPAQLILCAILISSAHLARARRHLHKHVPRNWATCGSNDLA